MMSLQWYQHLGYICLILFLICTLILHWQYLSSSDTSESRSLISLVHSGLTINSFNPSILHLTFTRRISLSYNLVIIDNNVNLFHLTNSSSITMIFSDGYHHLDFILFDQTDQMNAYQTIDISTGSQSLVVTILDQQYQPVKNISVHLEFIDHPNIHLDQSTNRFGEVIFRYLPRHIQVYIETICRKTRRHAYMQMDTLDHRNITLILKAMTTVYQDEYDPLDRGYYAV